LKTRSLPPTRPSRISHGDAASCSGFVDIGTPEELIALQRRFIETKEPWNLRNQWAWLPRRTICN